MTREVWIAVAAVGLFIVLFILVQWRAARSPFAPLRRLPVEKQRELVRLNRQLEQAIAERNDRDVYYYDGLMVGILALYLPELEFIQIRHILNTWRGEL